jgi:hypothetical protein
MKTTESIEVVLSSADIERLCEQHAMKIMESKGYSITHSRNEEWPIPDIVFIGVKIES